MDKVTTITEKYLGRYESQTFKFSPLIDKEDIRKSSTLSNMFDVSG